jgi:hypothetical protein
VSLALGAFSLWATYRAGRLAFGSPWLAIGAVAYLALNPQFIYLHSVVTNDSLATATGSLIALAALLLLREPRLQHFALSGTAIALAALSKPSALTLFPGLAYAVVVGWRALERKRERCWAILLVAVIPTMASGWWFLRNLRLYGDWMGMAIAKQALALNYYPEPLNLSQLIAVLPRMLWQTFQSSWGYFGWLSLPMPSWVFYGILCVHAAALAGLLARRSWSPRQRSTAIALVSACLGLLVGFLYYNLETNSSGWHGRFLFPGLSLLALGFVAGLRQWVARREGAVAAGVSVSGLMLLSGALGWVFLPVYSPPPTLSLDAQVPNRLDARFAGGLALVGYELHPDAAKPGGQVRATLYWRRGQNTQEYRIFSSASTPGGVPVIERTESPLPLRHPVATWPMDKLVVDRQHFRVQQRLRQVAVPLTVQVLAGYADPRPVPYVDDEGRTLADALQFGRVAVGPGARPQRPSENAQAQFGADEILLLGHQLDPAEVGPGEAVTVTLRWQAALRPGEDYQAFVHAVDQNGALVAQHDGPPRMGLYPTSVWAPGEVVEDTHPVPISSTFEGSLQLYVGLYRLETMERLPVTDAQGMAYPGGAYPLASMQVKRHP